MNILQKLTLLGCVCLAAACTTENELSGAGPSGNGDGTDLPEQEVLLSFDNKLSFPQPLSEEGEAAAARNEASLPTRAADETIATEDENRISSLDIYVFAAEDEAGPYSFQELLYYRDDPKQAPAEKEWVKPFNLLRSEDGNNPIALLKVQKGLFVKLFCIANQTTLRIPDATADGGYALADINKDADLVKYFTPLEQTKPGDENNEVTLGKPMLADFELFTTPVLVATSATDTIVTPLPMVDNSNTALDLRDLTVSSRLKEGFRLNRVVARFDIVNVIDDIKDADGNVTTAGSGFTIHKVYMVNGRPASHFFPAKATTDEVITYPSRSMKASVQTGRVPGSFYTYASPLDDKAYLVLEGMMRINKTETKEVSYPVYFRDEKQPGRYLEVQPNHRYSINISAADDYQLQFHVSVEDWNDEGNVDDYNPDDRPGDFTVVIPDELKTDDQVTVDADTTTVTMKLDKNKNKFSVVIKSNSALSVPVTYRGNAADSKWLAVSKPTVKPVIDDDKYTNEYTYEVGFDADYAGSRYPVATIHFIDLVTGNEITLDVKLVGIPTVAEVAPEDIPAAADVSDDSKELNKVDPTTRTASLMRMSNSKLPLSVICEDGIEWEAKPDNYADFLDIKEISVDGSEHFYTVKLTDKDAVVPDNKVEISFKNAKEKQLVETVTILLTDAEIASTFEINKGVDVNHIPVPDGNTDPARTDSVTVPLVENNAFEVTAKSVKGTTVEIEYNNGPHWLTYEEVKAAAPTPDPVTKADASVPAPAPLIPDTTLQYKFKLVEDSLVGAKTIKVTLKNNITSADDFVFTVRPKATVPEIKVSTTSLPSPSQNAIDTTAAKRTITMYKLPEGKNSTYTLDITYLGGHYLTYDPGTDGTTGLVTIDPAAGYRDKNEGSYTLTATTTGKGELYIVSAVDSTKTKYTLQVDSSEITLPKDTIILPLIADSALSIKNISSPMGFVLSNDSIEWEDGTTAWFELVATGTIDKGDGKEVGVRVKSALTSLTKDNVKTAKVKLSNQMTDAADTSIVVVPKWAVPASEAGQTDSVTIKLGVSAKDAIHVEVPYGGMAAVCDSTDVADISVDATTGMIEVTAKTGMEGRTATIKVYNAQLAGSTLKEGDYKLYTVVVDDGNNVIMGNVIWAVGNLVADGANGCKIGSSTDIGLYFRWGSLVGYTGNNISTPAVKPSEYASSPGFTSSPNLVNVTITDTPASGTGDPCRYYLKGKWRMPTSAEYQTLGGVNATGTTFTTYLYTSENGVNGIRIPKTGTPYVFFPLSGNLNFSSGALQYTTYGYYWSSSPRDASSSWGLSFYSGNAYVSYNNPKDGFPVRCVQEK